jgi:hypothetical protein
MAGNAHYRLIITAEREKGFWSGGLKNETGIIRALNHHIGMSANEVCISFLMSERPYVLPLLFGEDEAGSFATELKTAGCNVEIMPFGE